MKFYQNEAVKLFQQIKCLLNVKLNGCLFQIYKILAKKFFKRPEQTQLGEKEIIDWIERSLGIVLSDGFRDLQDGIILCR